MRKLTHEEIVNRQQEKLRTARIPLTVILNNIRSLYNVGSIFRTADGVGVEKIWLCGITGYPPHGQISKTALGAETIVPWEYAQDAVPVVRALKERGYQIAMLEQTDVSEDYYSFHPQRSLCLIVGNEIEGVNPRLIPLCDAALEIEMRGSKNSLNVAVAFGVVAYHLSRGLPKVS